VPASVVDAVAMAEAALAYLTRTDLASVPADTQAECLRGLARAEALHLVARSDSVKAFCANRGFEADWQYSAGAWLRWQTRVTRRASTLAVSWARRLDAHPAVRDALAAGQISVSWAQQICAWTEAGLWPALDDGPGDLNLVPGPAWLDEAGARCRERLRMHRAPRVIGHADWHADNVLWSGDKLLIVHDWDSVVCQPEAVIAGMAAAMFPASGAAAPVSPGKPRENPGTVAA
jgi:hypothetical protein